MRATKRTFVLMRNATVFASLLGLTSGGLVATSGCGGGGGNDALKRAVENETPVLATGQFDVLRFTLRGKRTYAAGQKAPFVFTVTNTGGRPIEVVMGPPFANADAVRVGENDTAWTWSADKLFTAHVETLRFAPGETRTYDLEWPAPTPGTYDVNAWFNGSHVQFVRAPNPREDFNAGPARVTVE
jgi:hypothetical protein